MIFELTRQELETKCLAADKLSAILANIQTQGFVVVKDLVSPSTCELLKQSILEDADRVVTETEGLTPHEKSYWTGSLAIGITPLRSIC